MDSTGPIPFRASAAYGVRPTSPSARPNPTSAAGAAPSTTIRPTVVDQVETRSANTERLDLLVAGTVRSDINRGTGFDGDSVSAIPSGKHLPTRPQAVNEGPMHLYNRQADRIEAATGVALGRTLDLQG
ncbi:MAG: hypothetical protein CMJ23_00685 [Phycisphaerae bacterium]|nr:hypothetical protein [Phycisphaerae bacterium]